MQAVCRYLVVNLTSASTRILFAVSFTLLMVGAISNSQSTASCSGLRHHHLLVVGGILCFIHGPFCIAYYVSCAAVQKEEEAKRRREEAHHQGRVWSLRPTLFLQLYQPLYLFLSSRLRLYFSIFAVLHCIIGIFQSINVVELNHSFLLNYIDDSRT